MTNRPYAAGVKPTEQIGLLDISALKFLRKYGRLDAFNNAYIYIYIYIPKTQQILLSYKHPQTFFKNHKFRGDACGEFFCKARNT